MSVLSGWLKRLKKGDGVHTVSARDWDRICSVLEGLEGVGCRIEKSDDGHGWKIHFDGSSDVSSPVASSGDPWGSPLPDSGDGPEWEKLWVGRRATQEDVDADADVDLGQMLLSERYVWCGPEKDTQPTVPYPIPD